MISNGDDNEVETSIGGQIVFDSAKYNSILSSFKQYTKRYADSLGGGSTVSSGGGSLSERSSSSGLLKSQQFRFMSVVTFTQACLAGAKANQHYKKMSNDLYSYSLATDQSSRATPDSYDICQSQYSQLFASVNNSIQQLIIAHKYDHWLVTNNMSANIATNNIQVSKVLANGTKVSIPNSNVNGFQYVGAKTNQNTRYEPSAGEPKTGLMVQLFGSARVNYPECLLVKTNTPIEYFGWIVIPREPKQSSIIVKVRGNTIPAGGANGWSYEGYKLLQNIKIVGPNSESDLPAIKKTGYFIKLNGTSIYQSGDSVEVFYLPTST
jgi:hypothetical protein